MSDSSKKINQNKESAARATKLRQLAELTSRRDRLTEIVRSLIKAFVEHPDSKGKTDVAVDPDTRSKARIAKAAKWAFIVIAAILETVLTLLLLAGTLPLYVLIPVATVAGFVLSTMTTIALEKGVITLIRAIS